MRTSKSTMLKLVLTIALAISTGMVARAAQVGDSVFAFLDVPVKLGVNDPQEITHVVLESGVWEVTGQINFLALNAPAGTLILAGNVGVGELSFAPAVTASVQAEQVAFSGSIIRPVSLVPRTVDVGANTTTYLVAGLFSPNVDVLGWGFITAWKIRNHVD